MSFLYITIFNLIFCQVLIVLTLEDNFWFSAQITNESLNLQCVRKNCIVKKLDMILKVDEISNTKSWAIDSENENVIKSSWFHMSRKAKDATLMIHIFGLDPVFGFGRICDETEVVSIEEFLEGTSHILNL